MEEYIQALHKQLKGFSPEDRTAVMEEICSHIESGEEDKRMGKDPEQRRKKLMKELGAPEQMGQGLKMVHRPNRFIDFLLIAIPLLIVIPYLNASLMNDYYEYIARIEVMLGLLLIAVGLWRQSALLTLFWTTDKMTQIIIMLWVAHGFYGRTQTVFNSAVAFGLLLLWGRIVWQNRRDILIVMYALLPLVLEGAGIFLVAIHPVIGNAPFGFIDRLLWVLYTRTGDFVIWLGPIIAMALFFLATNRNVRWLGLAVSVFTVGFGRAYLNLYENEQGLMAPVVFVFWIIFPLVIVFLGWWQDRISRQRLGLVAG